MTASLTVINTVHRPAANDRKALADWVRTIADCIENDDKEPYATCSTVMLVLVPELGDLEVRANGPDTNCSYRLMGYLQGGIQAMWDHMRSI
jgi:hypothetical protein